MALLRCEAYGGAAPWQGYARPPPYPGTRARGGTLLRLQHIEDAAQGQVVPEDAKSGNNTVTHTRYL